MRVIIGAWIVLLLGLTGCGPRSIPSLRPEAILTFHEPDSVGNVDGPTKLDYPELSDEDRARLIDVPLMVDCPVYRTSSGEDARILTLRCRSAISIDDILAFYRTQMECWGWNEIGVFLAEDSCLVYQKPTKMAVIQISKSDGRQYDIKIFIGPSRTSEL